MCFHTLFLGVLVKYDICDIVLTACSVHSGKTVACFDEVLFNSVVSVEGSLVVSVALF